MADDKIEEMIEEEQKDTIEDNKERTTHLDMINKQIDQANLLARIRNDFSKNVEKICGLMNELHDEIYSDDSWLRLVELNKINVLIDEALDYVWRSIYGKNREKHERINIDKDKDIDGHVSKYNIIVNVKLELMNIIGELINSAMIEVQNEVGMINDVKHASEIEIDALKLLYSTLAKILKKWRDVILGMINSDNVCNKPDLRRKIINQILRRKIINQILRCWILRRKIINLTHQSTVLKIELVIGLDMRYKIFQNIRKF